MTHRRRTRRTGRLRLAGALVVLAALAAALGGQWPASSSSTAAPLVHVARSEQRHAHRDALGEAGGAVPGGTTVFDGSVPGVARLRPALSRALRQAAAAAADDGVAFVVDSGWRSPAYQAHLLQDAVEKYGSAQEAARWVATPTTSAHVSGDAVDLAPAAAAWLSAHGAAYGLCRIYGNEPWHYELRPGAGARGCPAMYADAAHDPRLRR